MTFRLALILPIHLFTYVFCYYTAYFLRFEFSLPDEAVSLFQQTVPFVVSVRFLIFLATGEWGAPSVTGP